MSISCEILSQSQNMAWKNNRIENRHSGWRFGWARIMPGTCKKASEDYWPWNKSRVNADPMSILSYRHKVALRSRSIERPSCGWFQRDATEQWEYLEVAQRWRWLYYTSVAFHERGDTVHSIQVSAQFQSINTVGQMIVSKRGFRTC